MSGYVPGPVAERARGLLPEVVELYQLTLKHKAGRPMEHSAQALGNDHGRTPIENLVKSEHTKSAMPSKHFMTTKGRIFG